MRVLAILILASVTGGCVTSSNCAGWRPILMSRQDVLTPGTSGAIVAHNRFGEDQRCWRAP